MTDYKKDGKNYQMKQEVNVIVYNKNTRSIRTEPKSGLSLTITNHNQPVPNSNLTTNPCYSYYYYYLYYIHACRSSSEILLIHPYVSMKT